MPKFSPTGAYVLSSDDLGALMGPDWWWLDDFTATGYLYTPRVPIPGRYVLRFPERTLEFVGTFDQGVRRHFYAAAGRWLLDRAPGGPVDSQGRAWPEAERAACGMGDQGEELFVLKPGFASFVIRHVDAGALDGEQEVPAAGQINAEVVMRGGRFLWRSPQGLREVDGTLVGPNGAMQTFRGAFGVGYVAGWGLAAWRLGTTLGWPLLTDRDAFWPDLWIDGPASLRVVASETAGDTGRLWFGVDLTAAPVDLAIPPWGPFTHPLTVAVIKDPNGETAAPIEVVVNKTGQNTDRDYFASADSFEDVGEGALLGVYSEKPEETAGLAAGLARDTRLLYVRDQRPGDPAKPYVCDGARPWDVMGIEFYWHKDRETFAAATDRWRNDVTALLLLWPGDCAGVLQFYCMGQGPPNELLTEDEVLAVQAAAWPLLDTSPRIKLALVFSYLRANGIVAHPRFRTALDRLLAAAGAAGAAVLTPVGTTPPPGPGPDPPPEPPPQPPIEVPMIIGPVKEIESVLAFINIEEVPHPDGQGLVALKTAAGKFKSLRPEGTWQDDADGAGAFERFLPSGAVYFAYRGDWPGAPKVVYYFARLAKIPYLTI